MKHFPDFFYRNKYVDSEEILCPAAVWGRVACVTQGQVSSRAGNPFTVLASTSTSYCVSGFRPVITQHVCSNSDNLCGIIVFLKTFKISYLLVNPSSKNGFELLIRIAEYVFTFY